MRWFWFLCLTAAALSDIKYRSVSCRLLAVCGIVGLIWSGKTGMWEHAGGIPAGLGLLIISRLTRGAVGIGDGWFLLVSAGYLNSEEIWNLFLGSMGISWGWSMFLILYRIWTKGDTRKDTIPFLACMWPVGLLILI